MTGAFDPPTVGAVLNEVRSAVRRWGYWQWVLDEIQDAYADGRKTDFEAARTRRRTK